MRAIGLGAANEVVSAKYAQAKGLCISMGDDGFANLREGSIHPVRMQAWLSFAFRLPPSATAIDIVQRLTLFLTQSEVAKTVVGQLVIVEPGSFHIRHV